MLINFRRKPDLTFAKIPHTRLQNEKYYLKSNFLCFHKSVFIKASRIFSWFQKDKASCIAIMFDTKTLNIVL